VGIYWVYHIPFSAWHLKIGEVSGSQEILNLETIIFRLQPLVFWAAFIEHVHIGKWFRECVHDFGGYASLGTQFYYVLLTCLLLV